MRFTLKSAIKLINSLVDAGFARQDIRYMLSERSNELLRAGVDSKNWNTNEKIDVLSLFGMSKSQALDIFVNNPLLLNTNVSDIEKACEILKDSGASTCDYVTLIPESLELLAAKEKGKEQTDDKIN